MPVLPRYVLFLLLASGPVLAGPRPESRWGLRWNAPVDCIQAASLARGVEERLGRSVFGPDPEFLIDGVLVRERTSGWKATLALVDARGNVLGSREVSTSEASCPALEPRLLLVLRLMIDPTAALSEPTPSGPPAPPPPPSLPAPVEDPPPAESVPPEPEPEPASEPTLPPRRSEGSTHWTVAATGAVGLGLEVMPGLSGAVWWGKGIPGGVLRFSLYPYSSLNRDGGQVTLMGSQLEGGVCPVSVNGGAGFVSGCATASLLVVLARSEGYRQDRLKHMFRGDVGLRVRLERRLASSTALHLGLGAAWGWFRPDIRVLKPNGTAEDLPLGQPLQATVDLGVTFLK